MSSPFTEFEQTIMQRVLDLAAKGRTTTQPNPMVGCVLVKDGEIIGEGYHQIAGGLHAEREALKQAGEAARGSTAYVNLEPCCHQGRTPPCTDGLIDAGVVRVVAAMRDPNPLVAGGGFEMLKLAGIDVASGLLEEQARWLNRGFVTRMRHARPWVVLKSAATLDGRTAAFDGESKWITGEAARHEVQHLRANSSAVVTGIGTVLADDPNMNVRLEGTLRQPLRVILDTQLRIPSNAKIVGEDVIVFTLSDDEDKIEELNDLGVEVIQLSAKETDKIDLKAVLEELARWQCNEVLIEAGQTLSGAFLDAGLIDELVLYYGGSVLGDQAKSMFETGSALNFAARPEFQVDSTKLVGDDVCIRAVAKPSVSRLIN